jgi:hypothetical protein
MIATEGKDDLRYKNLRQLRRQGNATALRQRGSGAYERIFNRDLLSFLIAVDLATPAVFNRVPGR